MHSFFKLSAVKVVLGHFESIKEYACYGFCAKANFA